VVRFREGYPPPSPDLPDRPFDRDLICGGLFTNGTEIKKGPAIVIRRRALAGQLASVEVSLVTGGATASA